jgi:hypothetical protein
MTAASAVCTRGVCNYELAILTALTASPARAYQALIIGFQDLVWILVTPPFTSVLLDSDPYLTTLNLVVAMYFPLITRQR